MTREDVQTFLTLCEAGSLTKAGERLFISQGTVSLRLKALESELGTILFSRGKGLKRLSLTAAGEAFLPLARQLNSLFGQAEEVRNLDLFRPLKICASDQINNSALIDFYADFPEHHPDIALQIWTEHSRETYHLVDNRTCDIGLCTTPYNYPDIQTERLYEERRVFVCHGSNPFCRSQSLADLDISQEIHVSYPTECDIWRRNLFPQQNRCLVQVGTLGMMRRFLRRESAWAIVPESIARDFVAENSALSVVDSPVAMPPRAVYLLIHKRPLPGSEELIGLFKEEITAYVKDNKILNLLQTEGAGQ